MDHLQWSIGSGRRPTRLLRSRPEGLCLLRAAKHEPGQRRRTRTRRGGHICRHLADKTPHHSAPRLGAIEHAGHSETSAVQHYRTQTTTVRHTCVITFNQGVRGSTPRRPTRNPRIMATFPASPPPPIPASRPDADILTTRPNIMGGHGRNRGNTSEHRLSRCARAGADPSRVHCRRSNSAGQSC